MAYQEQNGIPLVAKSKKGRIIQAVVLGVFLLYVLLSVYVPALGLPTAGDLLREIRTPFAVDADAYPFSAHFIDVGQADCALLCCGEDTIVIDTGDAEDYTDIYAYFLMQNIQEIDYLILSHAHADHIGCAAKIIEDFSVRNVILPQYAEANMPTVQGYRDVLYALSARPEIRVLPAVAGQSFSLENCAFTVLAPYPALTVENNASVVVRVTYQQTAFLFQGDAERESEQAILESGLPIQADVVKLGHHGSSTSSTDGYLSAVKPQLAIISCGENNPYRHPSEKVLKRLYSYHIDYHRTDTDGNIVVVSDGEKIGVQTER